jgi:hypothetical protein
MPNLEQELAKLLGAKVLRSSILRKVIGNCLWHGRRRLFWPSGCGWIARFHEGALRREECSSLDPVTYVKKLEGSHSLLANIGRMVSYYTQRP